MTSKHEGPAGSHHQDEPPDAAWEDMTTALSWIQGRLPRVAKGERADVVKDGRKLYDYDYATLTDVTEALFPLLSKVGLMWITKPTMEDVAGATRLVLKYELRHVNGQVESGMLPLPDRADPQIVGSHITYWRRYALLAITGLAPGGDDDGQVAKEAAGRGESLDEASELSLPPQDTDYLIATLQPDALTPIADYPGMWERVVRRRAAGKPSPVEYEGQRLSWAQLFAYSLWRRAEACATPDAVMALWNEAKQVGWGKLPWPWASRTFQGHLKARGELIKELDERTRVAELAITSADTQKELAAAAELANALRGKVPSEKSAQLEELFGERARELTRRDDPVGGPVEQYDNPSTADAPPAGEELRTGFQRYEELRAKIWKGEPLLEMSDALLGAAERGDITQEEHDHLYGMLHDRPEPRAGAYAWLMWQINTSENEAELDAVRDSVNERSAPDADHPDLSLTSEQAHSLRSIIANHRVQIREGKR